MAVVMAAGGTFGYLKSRSLPSLVSGLGFGLLYGVAGYLHGEEGHIIAAGTSIAVLAVMGSRLRKTRKFFPAGFITGCSALCLGYNSYRLYGYYY
ncbi:transmembrane protein 14C-like [Zophobas morio]|uniref:transmembrane protein 14C-like n=1 Tax=Zophobas morio TaxID=2755281 RepID=UPI003082F45B